MVDIKQNVSLQPFNSLAIPSVAAHFVELAQEQELPDIIAYSRARQLGLRVLGGGSNLVLADRVEACVVRNVLLGRALVDEDLDTVILEVAAGENWHELVAWSIAQGWSGLENLALIPGTVGAAPVQNIGAYGVEIADALVSVRAFDLQREDMRTLSNGQCLFEYRNSLFKSAENRYLICSMRLKLHKTFSPMLDYGPLQALKSKIGLRAEDVFDQVVAIRQAKLPDPKRIPNAGSFFKNPVVTGAVFQRLQRQFPDLVFFVVGSGYKLAAGWLIDKADLRGQFGAGGVGCYSEQALVLINPERASSSDVIAWSDRVQQRVEQLFGLALEVEPRFWT
ncbi:UDP-N-acetylmuramate dehydrogenase [Reinekea sp.]|uniref:UDP-N-acetylmuramate dehydrogenase n=1 Tax=Reinekea sp. TaxID=1970455 RepID=UPI002A82035F|nr:UDP-N-acetylmuramate dehydrogenase [Reinekea sp.]